MPRRLVARIERNHGRLDVLVNDLWGGDPYLQFGKPPDLQCAVTIAYTFGWRRLTTGDWHYLTLKLAPTVTGLFPARVHGPVPLQPPPLQPLKIEPAAGIAVNVTKLPLG